MKIRTKILLGIAIIMIVALLPSCNKKDSSLSDLESLLFLSLLRSENVPITFRYADDDSASTLSHWTAKDTAVAQKTNIAGVSFSDYGDGDTDGFTDRFLTPEEVRISSSAIYMFKKEEFGGPAAGAENFDNGDLLWECETEKEYQEAGASRQCGSEFLISDSIQDSVYGSEKISSMDFSQYDRVGINITSIEYAFKKEEMVEPAYAWMSLVMDRNPDTGEIFDKLHVTNRCILNGYEPAEYFSEQRNGELYRYMGYIYTAVRGSSLRLVTWDDVKNEYGNKLPVMDDYNYEGIPEDQRCVSMMYDAPDLAPVAGEELIRYDAPQDIAHYNIPSTFQFDGGYTVVFPVSAPENGNPKQIYVDIDATNALFYEVDGLAVNPDVFDPARDAPATDPGGNKNFKVYLPAISIIWE